MNTERRRYHRVPFDNPAELRHAGGESRCELMDLCLGGALLASCGDGPGPGTEVELLIRLDQDQVCDIRMSGLVVHREDGHLGIRCTALDLDSVAQLRRLVELNLGDAELLERDFEALVGDV